MQATPLLSRLKKIGIYVCLAYAGCPAISLSAALQEENNGLPEWGQEEALSCVHRTTMGLPDSKRTSAFLYEEGVVMVEKDGEEFPEFYYPRRGKLRCFAYTAGGTLLVCGTRGFQWICSFLDPEESAAQRVQQDAPGLKQLLDTQLSDSHTWNSRGDILFACPYEKAPDKLVICETRPRVEDSYLYYSYLLTSSAAYFYPAGKLTLRQVSTFSADKYHSSRRTSNKKEVFPFIDLSKTKACKLSELFNVGYPDLSNLLEDIFPLPEEEAMITIHLKGQNAEQTTVSVLPQESPLADIRQALKDQGDLSEGQSLLVTYSGNSGKSLDEGAPLDTSNMGDGVSAAWLSPLRGRVYMTLINVAQHEINTYSYKETEYHKLSDFQAKVHKHLHIPPGNQILIYQGKQLRGADSLFYKRLKGGDSQIMEVGDNREVIWHPIKGGSSWQRVSSFRRWQKNGVTVLILAALLWGAWKLRHRAGRLFRKSPKTSARSQHK